MAQPVKWFASNMTGAPVLSGTAGALITLLDACLKDGFNQVTLTSLVVASNVATGTYTAHGFKLNQVISITGATPAGLNAQWRVTSVTADTFTFTTSGIGDQTAGGTINAFTSPAGWTKPYSGTNKAVYQSPNTNGSQKFLRLDDVTAAQYGAGLLYETMSDVDTGTNSAGPQYFKKSDTSSSAARPWVLIADDRGFYLGVAWSNTTTYSFTHFGDFNSYVTGDSYNCRIQGEGGNPTSMGMYSSVSDCCAGTLGAQYASLTTRSYAAIYASTALMQQSMCAGVHAYGSSTQTNAAWYLSGNNGSGTSSTTYNAIQAPNPGDGGIHFFPVFLSENIAGSQRMLRGVCRGLLHVYETLPTVSGNYSILSGVNSVTEGLVMLIRSAGHVSSTTYPSTALAFELGDWG